MPRRPGSGRSPGDRNAAGARAVGPSRPSIWAAVADLSANNREWPRPALPEHRPPIGQVIDRDGLGRTQSGQGIAATQRRPATKSVPPHATACKQIARRGRLRAIGDPLGSKGTACVGHQIVVRDSLMRPDHASQTRMGNDNFPVVGDQDVLHADVAMDQDRLRTCAALDRATASKATSSPSIARAISRTTTGGKRP